MRNVSTPHLENGDFPDGIVPQDNNEGAVLYFSAQPNMGLMSGGNEIKFRGGAFRTSNKLVQEFLDWQVSRNLGIYKAEEAAETVKPGTTAPLNDEADKLSAETVDQGKSNASSVPPVQAQLAGKTGIATSLTAPQ
jgi:hypothetical protein